MRVASFAVFVLMILSLTISVLPTALLAQQKPPVPAAELQEPAKKAATEIYGERFKQPKTSAEKTALAAEMIEAATKVRDGSPDQYVLLKIAADIAATAGDAPTALQAVEKMAERFDVPGAKLTAETLLAAAGVEDIQQAVGGRGADGVRHGLLFAGRLEVGGRLGAEPVERLDRDALRGVVPCPLWARECWAKEFSVSAFL